MPTVNASDKPAGVLSLRKPLLIFLEGMHDIACLKQFSRLLHADNPTLPDVSQGEASGRLLFLPVGGSNLENWGHRLEALGYPEFHLYDREAMGMSTKRAQIVSAINSRPFCRAVLTQKRTLEAYLHPRIVSHVFGIEVDFGDQDDVSEMVARRLLQDVNGPVWDELSSRSRRRQKDRVKRRLHHEVLSLMTSELLAERDPQGEVIGWFRIIYQMALGT